MLCPSCGAELIQGAKYCPMCGAPATAQTNAATDPSQTFGSYGSYDAASAGPTPVSPDGGSYTYGYDTGDTPGTGSYGTADTVNYDANEWPQASSLNQPYDAGAYGAPTSGFPMPTGMLIWSVVMIFFTFILGIISTILCVLAKNETTQTGYDGKVKAAKIINIIGTVLVVLSFFVVGAGGCVAFQLANDEDFMNSIDEWAQDYDDGDFDEEDLDDLIDRMTRNRS